MTYPFHYDRPALRISDSEIVVQKVCLQMIAVMFRQSVVFAVPNGTHIRSMAGRMKAKREGLFKGASDLVITSPGNVDNAWRPLVAFAEIKAKESLTDEQKDFLNAMHGMGHHCGCFRSDLTLADKLREWGFR